MSADMDLLDEAQPMSDVRANGTAQRLKQEPWWPAVELDPWCPWTWRDFCLPEAHDQATRPAS
jgi:hypothetical protein